MATFNEISQVQMGPVPVRPQNYPVPIADESGFPMLRWQPDEVIEILRTHSRRYYSFWWRFVIAIPNPGDTVRLSKNIQHDSYFAAQYMVIYPKTVTNVIQDFELELMDTSQSITYMDEALNYNLINGSAQNPFWFPHLILFQPNGQLTVSIHDLSGNANNLVYVLIGGVKYRM